AYDVRKLDLALQDSSILLASNRRNADWNYLRAQIYLDLKENDKALADIDMAIRLAPEAEFYDFRAELQMRRKEFASAVEDMRRGIEYEPTTYRLFQLARMSGVAGDMRQAI